MNPPQAAGGARSTATRCAVGQAGGVLHASQGLEKLRRNAQALGPAISAARKLPANASARSPAAPQQDAWRANCANITRPDATGLCAPHAPWAPGKKPGTPHSRSCRRGRHICRRPISVDGLYPWTAHICGRSYLWTAISLDGGSAGAQAAACSCSTPWCSTNVRSMRAASRVSCVTRMKLVPISRLSSSINA